MVTALGRIRTVGYLESGRGACPRRAARFSRVQAEENHRWTQMNTDSEVWTQVWLRFALGHCPVKGFSPWNSMASSRSYLCLSVSICGCIELLRFRTGPRRPTAPANWSRSNRFAQPFIHQHLRTTRITSTMADTFCSRGRGIGGNLSHAEPPTEAQHSAGGAARRAALQERQSRQCPERRDLSHERGGG